MIKKLPKTVCHICKDRLNDYCFKQIFIGLKRNTTNIVFEFSYHAGSKVEDDAHLQSEYLTFVNLYDFTQEIQVNFCAVKFVILIISRATNFLT